MSFILLPMGQTIGSPVTDLTEDGKGNLYGGAQGGTYGSGVIFKITP